MILTLRGDFYDRILSNSELGRLIKEHSEPVLPMSITDLKQTIEYPAKKTGLTFDEGLVGDLVFETRDQVGGLPLLQFTLDLLYQRSDGLRLTRAAYEALGGVRGALAKHAEATYKALGDERQSLARSLFLRLIEPGATEQDTTRRRAHMTELMLTDAAETDRLREVADRFMKARLLTTSSAAGEETIEVSHEALIREWKRLQDWLHYAREDIVIQHTVSQGADVWVKAGRPEAYDGLYRGSILLEKLAWAQRMTPSADEAAFIAASQVQSERDAEAKRQQDAERLQLAEEKAAAEEQARIAQSDRASRYRTWTIILAGVGVVVSVIAIVAGIVATDASNRSSQSEHDLATAQFGSTLSVFEGQRLSTLIPGLGQIPPTPTTTVAPQTAFATATQIAVAYGHEDDIVQTFDGVDMVQVPAGCFFMGSSSFSDAVPINQQCFEQPFWIDRFEVTNGQYQRIAGKQPPSKFQGANRPVESISWFDARDFCVLRGQRLNLADGVIHLPTEAEWEYAAAGPDSWPYPWGGEFPTDIERYAVYQQQETGDVGVGIREQGHSWVGAFDMAGNVLEWTSSLDATNGREGNTNSTDERVLRGGAWNSPGTYPFRASYRGIINPGVMIANGGFRCARSS